MFLTDVVKKLIGPVVPVGETRTDDERLSNLEEMITVVDHLIWVISKVAENQSRVEFSMKRAGERAAQYLRDVHAQTEEGSNK